MALLLSSRRMAFSILRIPSLPPIICPNLPLPIHASYSTSQRPVPTRTRARSALLAILAILIIGVGANTGASLRADQESAEIYSPGAQEQTPEERVRALEARKREIVRQREEILIKLDETEGKERGKVRDGRRRELMWWGGVKK